MKPSLISRRSFLGLAAGGSALTLLAACGGTATPAPPTAPAAVAPASASTTGGPAPTTAPSKPSGQKITLQLEERANNIVKGGAQYELYRGHLDQWKAAHPNVEVKLDPLPPGNAEYGPKLLSLFMGGTIGDLCYCATGSGSFQYVAALGIAAPLDDLVKRDNIDLNQWLPNMTAMLRVSPTGEGAGTLYGLPLLAHARDTVLFYNKTLFDKAKIKYPDGNTMSFDDLVETAKGLTTKSADGRTETYGLVPSRGGFLFDECPARAFGGDLLSEDGKKAQFNSPDAKKAYTWTYDLHNTYKVTPLPSLGTVADVFLSGKVAMVVSAGNSGYTFSVAPNLDWDATPYPKGPSGKRGSLSMGDAYALTTKAKQKDLAWSLIQWLTNKDAGVVMCTLGLCGARMDVYNDPKVKAMRLQEMYNKLVQDAMPFRGPANLRMVEFNDVSNQVTTGLWTGQAKPDDEFFDGLNTKMQQVLDEQRQ